MRQLMSARLLIRYFLVPLMTVGSGVFAGCSKSASTTDEVRMFPVEVGTKTDLYEVVAPNALRLAPGVTFRVVTNPGGRNSGIVILTRDNKVGGYMQCGCVGATTSTCVTVSDNPEHPSCSGGCTDSEGNGHGCELFGPLPGPPRDPARVRFLARPR
jgi:hypothetical protein